MTTTTEGAPPSLRTNPDTHPAPTLLADIRGMTTVPVWHRRDPNAAGLLNISRELAYRMAHDGDLPVLRMGRRRMVVPVLPLRRMVGDLPPLPEPVQDGAAG